MRTNIVLDSELVAKSMKITGIKTKRELVDYALRELLRHAEQTKLLSLKGKINWEDDLSVSRKSREFD
jgi:Arc/MetJ family transcription regulator